MHKHGMMPWCHEVLVRLERDDAYGSTGIIPDTGEELGKSRYRLNQYPLDVRGNVRRLPRKGNSKLNFLSTRPSLVESRIKNQNGMMWKMLQKSERGDMG